MGKGLAVGGNDMVLEEVLDEVQEIATSALTVGLLTPPSDVQDLEDPPLVVDVEEDPPAAHAVSVFCDRGAGQLDGSLSARFLQELLDSLL